MAELQWHAEMGAVYLKTLRLQLRTVAISALNGVKEIGQTCDEAC